MGNATEGNEKDAPVLPAAPSNAQDTQTYTHPVHGIAATTTFIDSAKRADRLGPAHTAGGDSSRTLKHGAHTQLEIGAQPIGRAPPLTSG